jgi:signal transduction histidine kinase
MSLTGGLGPLPGPRVDAPPVGEVHALPQAVASPVRRRGAGGRGTWLAFVELAAAGLLLTGFGIGLVLSGPTDVAWFPVLVAFMALTYVAAGLLAWHRRPSNRTGPLLCAAGLVWYVTVAEYSGIDWLVAAAVIIGLVPLAMILHLLLAFPSGRVSGRLAVGLVVAGYVLALVLEAPRYLFGPEPSGLLQVADLPGLVTVMRWLEAACAAAIIGATSVVLVVRLRRASPARRRTLTPLFVLGIATIVFIIVSANILVPLLDLDALRLAVLQLIAVAVIPVAFTLGVLRGGFARTAEIEDLGAWLGSGDRGLAALHAAMRETLGDPTLEVRYWTDEGGTYVGEDGVAAPLPSADGGRGAIEIVLAGRRIGAIVYDATLFADAEPVRAAAAVVAIAVERERLTVELAASAVALRESRARVVSEADDERRRIGRDLHDGIQARLTLLVLGVATARQDIPEDAAARESIDAISVGLSETIDELRRLVHGVMPAVLVERGLVSAVEDLVDQSPLPVTLELAGSAELLPAVAESTAYFVVAEGLSNALKYARASWLTVRLARTNGRLAVEVHDDGVGGASAGMVGGIRGLADRLDAVGGRLEVISPAGGGTRLVAEVPCES